MWGRLAGVLLVMAAGAAHAHPLAPCVLELHEAGAGRVTVGWKTPLLRPRGAELHPVLPARCRPVEPQTSAEEDGGISLVVDGRITRDLDAGTLRSTLQKLLVG